MGTSKGKQTKTTYVRRAVRSAKSKGGKGKKA